MAPLYAQLPSALAYILDGISLGARDFQFLGPLLSLSLSLSLFLSFLSLPHSFLSHARAHARTHTGAHQAPLRALSFLVVS